MEVDGNGNPVSTEGYIFVDPGEIDRDGTAPSAATGTGTGAGTRTRKVRSDAGQPRGTRTGASGRKTSEKRLPGSAVDLSALQGVAVAIYMGIARLSKHDEWEITQEEAENLTQKIENVARHYSIQTTQKAIDIAALGFVFGTMNISRIMVIAAKKKDAKQPQRMGQVVPIRPNVQPSQPEPEIDPDVLLNQLDMPL